MGIPNSFMASILVPGLCLTVFFGVPQRIGRPFPVCRLGGFHSHVGTPSHHPILFIGCEIKTIHFFMSRWDFPYQKHQAFGGTPDVGNARRYLTAGKHRKAVEIFVKIAALDSLIEVLLKCGRAAGGCQPGFFWGFHT